MATVGLKDVGTGDTICDEDLQVMPESIILPELVIRIAIEPKTQSDQAKLGEALNWISAEDPTFKVSYNSETGQTSYPVWVNCI